MSSIVSADFLLFPPALPCVCSLFRYLYCHVQTFNFPIISRSADRTVGERFKNGVGICEYHISHAIISPPSLDISKAKAFSLAYFRKQGHLCSTSVHEAGLRNSLPIQLSALIQKKGVFYLSRCPAATMARSSSLVVFRVERRAAS